MASKNLPTNLTGGEPAHPDLHNDANEVVNLFDWDLMAAGGEGQTIKKQASGLWAPDTDLQSAGGTGWGTDVGIRFVSVNGSDLANGLSPDTAMATLSAAVASMQQSGIGLGGYIYMGKGEHITNNVQIDLPVHIIGMGRRTTRLAITQNDACAIQFQDGFFDGYLGKLQITDKSNVGSGINARSGIWISDNGQESIFEDILIDGLGDTYGGVHSIDDTPAGIRVEGPNVFGDWMQFRNIRTRGQQTSMAITSGCNGWVQGCAFGGARHSLHVLKRDALDGDSIAFRFRDCQFIGGLSGTTAESFSVLIDNDNAAQLQGALRFDSCFLEISGATDQTQGFYVNLTDVVFNSMQMTVTNMPVGGKALHVGPTGEVVFGPYTQDGLDPATEVQVDAGGELHMWQEADYTGP